ncbi:DUF1688 family protein [Azoarcus indigens]|uniref:Uncharacterized protein DUF1688 n=1 Tax=Azoarcus indigens TaxID=29545 RepID=A0A4R6DWH5_9RHOO|nr:URC4/urg3 family protein [Azoarcus indigens]NMG65112.1 DUF1688 family protein [Azoarcus indigens]TDN49630.1 uncharacterized protein DUF1688 [Azoarcus indigens]
MNLPHEGSGWHTPVPAGHPAAALLRAEAVRERCAVVMARVQAGDSPLFEWHSAQLAPCAAYVADTVRRAYPDLAVPYHSRWRHFEAGGRDRWAELQATAGLAGDARECARVAVDLVIPSVLLDAGAGPDWRFHEADDQPPLARSEGLAVASLALFAAGTLSDDPGRPLRSDAAALRRIDAAVLGALFQVSGGNPLLGLEGRATLLNRLGEVAEATPAVFGRPARLGNLVDHLFSLAADGRLPAAELLALLLRALGPVWPGRLSLAGVPLGDCWRHPALADELLPFHKLTQWLAYSLLEPLQAAGLEIAGLDALTGLPEYRNGGLLLDFGVIVPRHPAFFTTRWTVDALPIVEWRALTVAGLDRLAEAVRAALDVSAAAFPLARVLQGGSWSAGRRIAAERRPGGPPPLQLESDGTVF